MRLIDADWAASIENLDQYSDLAAALGDVQTVRDILSDAPTIDAVPVVRCKNCKHFNLQTHECENESLSTDHEGGASYSLNFYDDDFCSYGEWREADHD